LTLDQSHFDRNKFAQVYVCGDIHGDFTVLWRCLTMARLATKTGPGRYAWTAAPKTALLLLGDVVDRYRSSLVQVGVREEIDGMLAGAGEQKDEEANIMRCLNQLAADAETKGGAVLRLFGNHEFMQHSMDSTDAAAHYVSPYAVGIKQSDSASNAERKLEARGKSFFQGEMQQLVGACRPKAIVQVGHCIFMHDGLDPRIIPLAEQSCPGRSLLDCCNDIAARVWNQNGAAPLTLRERHLFNTLLMNGGARAYPHMSDEEKNANRLLMQPGGILWDDWLASAGSDVAFGDACKAHVSDLFDKLNKHLRSVRGEQHSDVRHIAVAHCQQTNRGKLLSGDPAFKRYGQELGHVEVAESDYLQTTYSAGPNNKLCKRPQTALAQGLHTRSQPRRKGQSGALTCPCRALF
jgi:hypothetical protein